MPRRPQGPTNAAAKRPSRLRLSRWNPRDPLTVTITYRGGTEAWYELKARGRTYRTPGVLALHDVLQTIYHDGHPD